MRGHVNSRGPLGKPDKNGKRKHEGAPWLAVVELGEQPAQRCPTCVDPRGGHKLLWVQGRKLAECPRCGGPLDDVKARRQFTRTGIATKREAEALVEAQLGERKAGTYVEPTALTVAEFLTDRWLPDTENARKPSTHASYAHHVDAYLVPALGTLLLRHLDAGHINAMYTDLAAPDGGQRGKGLSPATRRRIHHTLRRALRDALKWKLVQHNAAASADPPALDSVPETMHVWTREQLRVFLDHVADDPLFALWRTVGTTGMRRGELCGLQWRHVDFEHSTLRVQQARVVVGYEVVLSTPKTKRGRRSIPVGPGTLDVLKAWRDAQADALYDLGFPQSPATYLFTDAAGEPLHPERVTTMFNEHQDTLRAEILKHHAEAGAEGEAPVLPRIRLHDVRHTYATLGALDGIPAKVMAERLGQDVMTYMQTYVHNLPGMSGSAAELLEARLDAD